MPPWMVQTCLSRLPGRRLPVWRCGLLLLGLFLLAGHCRHAGEALAAPGETEAVPVMAATVRQETVPLQVRGIGTVEAYATVAVKSQISGELFQVHFTEGQDVTRGELLFTVDPRPFEAALRQAQATLAKDLAEIKLAAANLARDTAQAHHATVQASRYRHLAAKGVVSAEDYDQMRTNAKALAEVLRADRAAIEHAQALVRADRAAVDNAKLQLTYCSIHAPLNGRAGRLLVDPGNVVKADDTVLVNLEQLQPINVTFAVPEQDLPRIETYARKGSVEVEATLPEAAAPPVRGVLSFIDNAVDRTTGTIRLKGTFANRTRQLWPGQFVQVTLILTRITNAVVVPSQAIQTGQSGPFVFVIRADHTVESRAVVVQRTFEGNAVIQTGLRPGERVVTDGQLRLVPGAKVVVKSALQGNTAAAPTGAQRP
jgi:multidrug efflux system membrane fusion protein